MRTTLAYVERGEAEAGIVYETDALISTRVEVVCPLDSDSYDRVVYPLVLIKAAADKPAARALYDFLQSEAALAVFRRHGFTPLVSSSQAAAPSGEVAP